MLISKEVRGQTPVLCLFEGGNLTSQADVSVGYTHVEAVQKLRISLLKHRTLRSGPSYRVVNL
jgi:hypothetical protein